MKAIIIIIIYFILTLQSTCNAQYPLISSNLVQTGSIQSPTYYFSLTNPGDQDLSKTINFSTAFKSPPLVLISILKTDMQIKVSSNENINTQVTSISTTSFNLSVSKKGSIQLDEIFYYYAAIEPSKQQDTYVLNGTIDFQANLVTPSTLGLKVAKKFFPYQRQLSSTISEQRKVSAYFIGYEKSVDTSVYAQSTTNIYLKIQQEQNGFYIIIESRDPKDDVNIMKTVSYNYIEFYEPTNGYQKMVQIKDIYFLNNVPSASMDFFGNTYLQFSTTIDINSSAGIFTGVSGVGYKAGLNPGGRVVLLSPQFTLNSQQELSTFTFKYQSWQLSQLTSVASETLAFVRQDCSALSQKFFDEGKQCLQTCPNRSYGIQDSTGRIFCQLCHSSCLTCSGASARECLTCEKFRYNQLCFEEQPDATGCDTIPSAASPRECVECAAKNCSVCNFTNTSECFVCSNGFVLKNSSTCFCESASQYYSDSEKKCIDKEDPFSKETKKIINDALETTETVTFGLSLLLVISSVFTQQGYVLMSSAFTNQKIFYILLFNADLPQYLLEFTKSLTSNHIYFQSISSFRYQISIFSVSAIVCILFLDHGVLKKFSYLNWIWNESYSTEFQVGNKFDSESITSNIMVNSGGGLVFISLSAVLFIVFFILSAIGSCKPRILDIYTRYIGGFLTESLEITILVLQFSVAIALTQTSYFKNKQEQTLVLVFCQLFVLAFMGLSFAYLIQQSTKIEQRGSIVFSVESTKTQVIIDKLNNGCIKERRFSKVYMFIFLLFEAGLFPILIVAARSSFIIQIIGVLILQTCQLISTFAIWPFQVLRENKVQIFVQVNTLLIYCTIAIVQIGLIYNNSDSTEIDFPLYINGFALSFIVLAIVAMITPGTIQIYLLFTLLKDYYKKKNGRFKNNNEPVELQMLSLEKLSIELMTYSNSPSNNQGKSQLVQSSIENAKKKEEFLFFRYQYHSYQQYHNQKKNSGLFPQHF